MERIPRRVVLAIVLLAIFIASQLVLAATAPTASAATTCKRYVNYTGGDYAADGTWSNWSQRNVTVCAAPSSDFPNYSGWGRMLATGDAVRAFESCTGGNGLLPLDEGEWTGMPCAAPGNVPRQPAETTWAWTAQGWRTGPAIETRSRAYFAPYASGWRWGWTQRSGWFAIPAKNAYFLWYA